MSSGEKKSCDYLVFYSTSRDKSKAEIVCFLELKGKDFRHAVEQICNTYKQIKAMLEKDMDRKYYSNILYCAYICMHGPIPEPRYTPSGKEKLKQTFGSLKLVSINHNGRALDEFLRRLYPHKV